MSEGGRPAAFLDRDGVLNVDSGFVWRREDWVWIPGAKEAVALLKARGYATVVVTNQSGIGRGMYSQADFEALMAWVRGELETAGGGLDAVYSCPTHPTDALPEYRIDSDCRKPKPGMLLQAISELGLDPVRSFLIGDRETDIQAAEAAGVRGYLFRTEDLGTFVRSVLDDVERSMASPAQPKLPTPILFFDGECGLCQRSVQFVLKRDKRALFSFAPLQGETAQAVLGQPDFGSVILVDEQGRHVRSSAALRTVARLGLPWSLLSVFRIVPRPIRDAVYRWVAKNRLRFFGQADACRLPTPEERSRFLP